MPILRIVPIMHLIGTFMYLMMCPVVLELGNGYIDNNVTLKDESFKKQVKTPGNTSPLGLPANARVTTCSRSKTLRDSPFPVASHPGPTRSILSTSRLLL